MYAKELRQKLDRIASDMRALLKKAEDDNNRALTSEELEKWNKMLDEHDRTEETIKLSEKQNKLDGDLRGASRQDIIDEFPLNPGGEEEKDAYAKVFSKYVRFGAERLTGDEKIMLGGGIKQFDIRNTMSTTTGSQGGFIIPTGFSGLLEIAKKWFGGIEGVVGKFQTSTGNPWPWPTVNDTANKGRVIGQNVQNIETDKFSPAFA